MTVQAFVDESKGSGYLVAAAVLMPNDLGAARRTLAGLVLPGQRRLHFTKERDSRRWQILNVIAALPSEIVIYDGSAHPRRDRRAACLTALVGDLAKRDARLLVLERDDAIVEGDLRQLYLEVRAAGCEEMLQYRCLRAHEEPLLAIPDAVAWCWARGGVWRRRVRPIVAEVRGV